MLKGTIIENSLQDKSILKELNIQRSYPLEDWILHDILIEESDVPKLSQYLADGPWYIHVWDSDTRKVIVVFKDKLFHLDYLNKATWREAIIHGKSMGIPEEQLDFLIS